jgi:hypothetical protein
LAAFAVFPNVTLVIGFLRLIGVLNAGIWLGGIAFFSAVVNPALNSPAMKIMLQEKNFPYFSPAIEHVLLSYYFQFSIVCALIALLHLSIEWLYLGRPSRKLSFGLLAALLLFGVVGGKWLQPRLQILHGTRFLATVPALERESAMKSYQKWHATLSLVNLVVIGGLCCYFWQITRQPNTPRFASSVKFRG